MLYLLPTDIIICCLMLLIIVLAVKLSRRDFWQQIFASSVSAPAFILLLCFAGISLLDSIHLSDNKTDKTLFDQLLKPIGTRDEFSYSQPFATTSFIATTTKTDGKITRARVPLSFVNGQTKTENWWLFGKVLLQAFAGMLLLNLFLARKTKQPMLALWRAQPNFAARSILITVLLLLSIGFFVINFSQYYYLFGTDKTGMEVLYLGLKSIRTGMAIGLITILFSVPIAVLLGIAAGYFGGRIDSCIQYVYTTLSSVPGVLLIAAAILSLDLFMDHNASWFANFHMRADVRLFALCFILGVTGWTGLCRLLRGEVMKLRELDFVIHAQIVGLHPFKIMLRHILPNVMHIVIITTVLDFSGLVLAEAVLSYIGVGVDPTTPSFGNMINAARLELSRDPVVWWPLLCAVGLMFVLVLSVNLFADKVRNLHDPRRL